VQIMKISSWIGSSWTNGNVHFTEMKVSTLVNVIVIKVRCYHIHMHSVFYQIKKKDIVPLSGNGDGLVERIW